LHPEPIAQGIVFSVPSLSPKHTDPTAGPSKTDGLAVFESRAVPKVDAFGEAARNIKNS
jgi:hypothetical protein